MTTLIHPLFAANAAVYAIQNATTEGKITVIVLLVLSLFSWTIIITKFRQLNIARKATKKFFAAYASTRDPLDISARARNLTARRRINFIFAARTNWRIN
jgi:biopolymer transport protein ExbB/TolQ